MECGTVLKTLAHFIAVQAQLERFASYVLVTMVNKIESDKKKKKKIFQWRHLRCQLVKEGHSPFCCVFETGSEEKSSQMGHRQQKKYFKIVGTGKECHT